MSGSKVLIGISVCGLLFLLGCNAHSEQRSPQIESFVVGGKEILVPAPISFIRTESPGMLRLGQNSTIQEDRLLAVFAPEHDVREAGANYFAAARYALVQSSRNTEPHDIPLSLFAKYKSDTKSETAIGGSEADATAALDQLSDKAFAATGHRLAARVLDVGEFQLLDETPASLTLVTKMLFAKPGASGEEEQVAVINGISQVLLNSKVVWLQVYSRGDSAENVEWVARTIESWTDSVVSSNSD